MKSKTLASQQGVGNTTEVESLGEETVHLSSPSWVSLSQSNFVLVWVCGKEVARNQANPFPNINTKMHSFTQDKLFGLVIFCITNTLIIIVVTNAMCTAILKGLD